MTETSDSSSAQDLVVRFARAAHLAGFPSYDLERRVEALGASLDLDVQASSTPTLLELGIGSFPRQDTVAVRVTPQPVDLDLVGRLDALAARVRLHAASPEDALRELERMRPSRRSALVMVAAYALAGGAVTPVLGGGWREAVAAAVVGLAVGVVALVGQRGPNARALVAPVAAVCAAVGCAVLARAGFENATEVATLGALVALLPGMTLTVGMRELATSHLQSGVGNAAVAFVQLTGLVFGVAVGRSIATTWFGDIPSRVPTGPSLGVQVVAAAVAGLAFTVTLNARRRDALWASAAAVLALVADALGSDVLGDQAGVFVAALAVGLAGNVFSLAFDRTALVVVVPGILILVPGALGYESATRLFANDTVGGISAAFDTLMVSLAIVYGLIVSAALLPSRGRRTG